MSRGNNNRALQGLRASRRVLISDDANSGIFIRCEDPKKPGAKTCYERNIFDAAEEAVKQRIIKNKPSD